MASFARHIPPDTKLGTRATAADARAFAGFLTGAPTDSETPAGRASKSRPSCVGMVIASRYRIVRVLGEGSFATVYEANDTRLSSKQSDALVAVKIARAETPLDIERWLDEAQNARRVQHRHVVGVLDCGVDDDGQAFTVMELVAGTTLEQHVAHRTKRSRRELVALLAQAAEGLEAIHAAGLVHCDIKPANLLIASDGTLRITDFGASTVCAPQAAFTSGGRSMAPGTLAFMAPELFRLDRESFMPTSDVFSLGATLFWALTGRPVAGDSAAEAVCGLGDRSGIDPARIERELRAAGVDRDLRAITMKALAPSVHERYGSAGVLGADLRAWAARRPVESTRPSAWRRGLLLLRRRPLASVAVLLALTGGITTAAAFEHSRALTVESNARAAELAVERAGREADLAWRKRALDSLRRLMSGFGAAKEQGLAAEVLTSLWVLEWAHGPTLLQDPEALGEVWAVRIEMLESVREQARAQAGDDSIEARLTEPSLVLWLLRDGRAAEAREILDGAIPFWEKHASAGDPWLRQLRLLDSIAAVNELTQAAAHRPLTKAEVAQLEQHESQLRSELDRLAESGDRGPVAQLLRETTN